MRRLFASLSTLALLGGLAGCQHTAGICDCDPCGHSCCCTCAGMGYRSACGAYYAPPAPVVPVAPIPGVEPPKVKKEEGEEFMKMPKPVDTDKKPEDKGKEPMEKGKEPDKSGTAPGKGGDALLILP